MLQTNTLSDNYLSQFKKDPKEILGERVLPPREKAPVPVLFKQAASFNREFVSPEQMAYSIERYFERFNNLDPDGPIMHPTMAGLAMALGFTSKRRMESYEEQYPDFAPLIELARTKMEDYKNSKLLLGGSATQAFALDLKNNHQWSDKVETKSSGGGDTLAALVQALQGHVHRPKICYDGAVDASFYDYEEYEPDDTLPTEDNYDLI